MERSGSSVLELRLRLYRPDPPEDAVAAYLAALAAVTPPPPEDRPSPIRRRHTLAAAAASVALVAAAAGGVEMAWQASAATRATDPTAAAASIAVPSVPGRPIGELVGGPGTTGLFDGRGLHVVVSVLCSGDGTITLRIGPEQPTVLTCQAGGPALAMLASTERLDRFTVTVDPQPHLRWSLAVGAMELPTG